MRRFVLIALAVLAALFLILVWVATDPTFIVRGDEVNLIENPNFDNPRGFDGWHVEGCASYVLSPKAGGAKAGPPQFNGLCTPGDTVVIWQSFDVAGVDTIAFSQHEILKGDNHLTITFDDGAGWQWVARETTAQNNGSFTPVVTSTLPAESDFITITINFEYCPGLSWCGIGTKITAVTVTSE